MKSKPVILPWPLDGNNESIQPDVKKAMSQILRGLQKITPEAMREAHFVKVGETGGAVEAIFDHFPKYDIGISVSEFYAGYEWLKFRQYIPGVLDSLSEQKRKELEEAFIQYQSIR
ncbi:hypothetical protein ACLI1A_10110 [Flavobacterium sp. RHBU_3]|uniref:hypothetical protein n=1 Tax=Flavobacterium sp. RHBU_3 TaxID=3391184 RepID=UPI003984CFF6